MIIYFVYFLIVLIFIFLIYTTFKALSRGMEAKNNIDDNDLKSSQEKKNNINIASDLEKLRKLYNQGVLSKDEFERAKDKIINS
tara:strand:+ start:212 stop:463 length:252 start_codon:yes stop_codon:yes gene_type:complete